MPVVNKNKIPKGNITLDKALEMLKEKSEITKMGLRTAAIRDGFKSEIEGVRGEKFLLDEVKFKKWIANTISAIPKGFVLVAKAAGILGFTSSGIYTLIKKHKMTTKIIGGGEGKIYVSLEALQKVIGERHCKKEKQRITK
jgi:hypothetical protein